MILQMGPVSSIRYLMPDCAVGQRAEGRHIQKEENDHSRRDTMG